MSKLSIIIPIFNEITYLEQFFKRLFHSFKNENVEYILVNDGSTDGSKEWLNDFIKKNLNKEVKYIDLKKNTGKGNALHEGIKIAIGDYVLFQDADLELDTNDSLEMYHFVKDNKKINCLFGSRYLSGKLKKNNNFLNEFIGKFNSFLFNLLFSQSLSDLHCGAKIISRDIIQNLNLTIKDFGFEIDIASQIARNNYDIYEYGISYFARSKLEGKKITWLDGLKSYLYLFKTRFMQNDLSIIVSLFYSTAYMMYVGTHFGMGIGKDMVVIFFAFIGMFIGLHKKIFNSSIVLLLIFIGSLFSMGNGKIYTVVIGFLIGLYLSKKISTIIRNNYTSKLIRFFF